MTQYSFPNQRNLIPLKQKKSTTSYHSSQHSLLPFLPNNSWRSFQTSYANGLVIYSIECPWLKQLNLLCETTLGIFSPINYYYLKNSCIIHGKIWRYNNHVNNINENKIPHFVQKSITIIFNTEFTFSVKQILANYASYL